MDASSPLVRVQDTRIKMPQTQSRNSRTTVASRKSSYWCQSHWQYEIFARPGGMIVLCHSYKQPQNQVFKHPSEQMKTRFCSLASGSRLIGDTWLFLKSAK